MSQIHSSYQIIAQNSPDFKLNIKEQPLIFQKKLVIKELNDIQEDPLIPRTITVRCLYKGCR